MKKILLGTTAIVGVALASQAFAAGPELKISGYAKVEAAFVDQDSTSLNRGYEIEVDDWELDFVAQATADNGLTYGAKLELQFGNGDKGYTSQSGSTTGKLSNDFTDEASIFMSGNWGSVILGRDDGAEDVYSVAGFGIIGGMGAWDGENNFTNPSGGLVTSSIGGDTGDAVKVSYFTPSFSGFSLGVSWTPDSGEAGNNGMSDDDTGDMENNLAIAAKYKGSFSDVGVEGSVRYVRSGYENNDENGATTAEEDVSAWAVGAKITYAGFALAGSYNDNGDSGVTKSTAQAGGDAGMWWDIALQYSTGPYSVAVGYYNSEKKITGTREAEVDYFAITGGWNVAPGLDFYAEYDYVDMEDGTTGTSSDNEASVFMVGTKVSF